MLSGGLNFEEKHKRKIVTGLELFAPKLGAQWVGIVIILQLIKYECKWYLEVAGFKAPHNDLCYLWIRQHTHHIASREEKSGRKDGNELNCEN